MRIDMLGQRTIEVSRDEADAISAEVDALGAADAIAGRTEDRATLQVTAENVGVIARALDHVHNAHQGKASTEDARDSLLRYLSPSPLMYQLRSWEFNAGEERVFWSYTGPYEPSDRLLNGTGQPYEVVRVERQATPLEPGVLLVQTSSSR